MYLTKSNYSRWILLGIVAMGLLLVTLDNSILYTALPTLVKEMGANHTESLWMVNAYPLVMAGLLIGTGSLGDRLGHRKLFLTGLIIFGLASIAAAFSPNPEWLIVSRAILAIGAASMMPATLALLRLTFHDPKEFNIAVAIWGSIATIGSSLGPVVSGLLLSHFWWGSVFLINVPVVVIAIIGTLIYAPKSPKENTKSWDIVSAIQFMVGLTGLVLLIKEAFKSEVSVFVLIGSVIAAVSGLLAFSRRQKKIEHPMLDFSIFRIPKLQAGVIGAFVCMFAIAGLQLITSQRYQLIDNLTPLQAGLIVASMAVGALCTSVLGGAIAHKTGLRPLISGGMVVGAIGVCMLIWGFPSITLVVLSLLLSGMGLGMVMAVASSAIVGSVQHEVAGVASSVEEVSYEIGSLLAVSIIGSLMLNVFQSVIQLPAGVPLIAKEGIEEALAIARLSVDEKPLLAAVAQAYDQAYIVASTVIVIVLFIAAIVSFCLLRKKSVSAT